ncbi:hypothetical protein R1flu_001696 [Riccia fluitans]|uniref:Uncharacterized protein n=1 Tax=Riccia fluitans TaxID=41844 RepID=A0ABD1Y406_9MARC
MGSRNPHQEAKVIDEDGFELVQRNRNKVPLQPKESPHFNRYEILNLVEEENQEPEVKKDQQADTQNGMQEVEKTYGSQLRAETLELIHLEAGVVENMRGESLQGKVGTFCLQI